MPLRRGRARSIQSQEPPLPPLTYQSHRDVDHLIEAAKRDVYTSVREKPDKDRAQQGG
jgi:hypothetical protein